jgi:general L-amino acid transport system permease protein
MARAFWRDIRFWRIASQIIFLVVLALAAWYLFDNMQTALKRSRIQLGFTFLREPASFDVGEKLIRFGAEDPYWRAFAVGILNTLKVAIIGIVLATPLGIVIGIGRLSSNWLVNKLATVYVEVLRNTPLLVQMVFWYFAVFIKLPPVRSQIVLPGPIMLNNRGVAIPGLDRHETFGTWMLITVLGLVAGIILARWLTRVRVETGRETYPGLVGLLLFFGAGALSWIILPGRPFDWDLPRVAGTNLDGGAQLTPEFAALVVSLVVYTSAFIGEIVRGGVQAVTKGQWEAARALGLNHVQMLRLVVFPQALRIIIPPLTSQYLNLTKNSSLAVAVGYPDLFAISTTIFNQTGRSVEVFVIVMLVYLTFSLTTSLLMNLYNRSVRLVER